jgi:hypothetical protein
MSLFLRIIFSSIAFAVPVYGTLAAEKKIDPHVATAVADHRAMAEAHLNAAKCLESGKAEKDCHAQLTKDCKGLGIGKYCGMKHKH